MTDNTFFSLTPNSASTKRFLTVPSNVDLLSLLGPSDQVLRALERGLPQVKFHLRGRDFTLEGDDAQVMLAERLLAELIDVASTGQPLTAESAQRALQILQTGARPTQVLNTEILSARGGSIRPKTLGQQRYVDAIDKNTIVFGIGPAGTGKTYLAMAKAVVALTSRKVSRIILTRPAVEAGERIGFLPGSITEKIDPYLRPLYDALHEMIDPDAMPRLMAAGTIEVAPLAYMRGRTLNDAFIILDEAQNTSPEQMKMFLTRLGFGSKVVVTGDITQVDLPGGTISGLRVVQDILQDVDDIEFCKLTSADVVRHHLVGEIIDAYSRWDMFQSRTNSKNSYSSRRGSERSSSSSSRRQSKTKQTAAGSAKSEYEEILSHDPLIPSVEEANSMTSYADTEE